MPELTAAQHGPGEVEAVSVGAKSISASVSDWISRSSPL
jgi:hypothetical protein